MLMTEMLKIDTNISILSSTHLFSDIRHQHRCNPPIISVLVTRILFVFQINVIHTLTCSSGPLIISLRWKQGPTPSISKAFLSEVVPVLPKPAPITFNSVLDFISKVFKYILFWWTNDTPKYFLKWIKFYFKNITKDILYFISIWFILWQTLKKNAQRTSGPFQRWSTTLLDLFICQLCQLQLTKNGLSRQFKSV